jgi:hypothetical protein
MYSERLSSTLDYVAASCHMKAYSLDAPDELSGIVIKCR